MTATELQSKISIILSQVGGHTVPQIYQTKREFLDLLGENFIAEAGQFQPIYEPLQLLRTLYAQCEVKLQNHFAETQVYSGSYDIEMIECAAMGRTPGYLEQITLATLDSISRSGDVEIRSYKLHISFHPYHFNRVIISVVDDRIVKMTWSG